MANTNLILQAGDPGPSTLQGAMGVIGDFAKARQYDQQQKEYEKKQQEDQDIQQAFEQHRLADGSPDYDAIVNTVSVKHPEKGMALSSLINQQRQQSIAMKKTELDQRLKALQMGLGSMVGVTDQADYDKRLAVIRGLDPSAAEMLGPTYDPDKLDKMLTVGMDAADALNVQRTALAGDYTSLKNLLQYASGVTTPEEYEEFKVNARKMGTKQRVIDMLPEFGPDLATFKQKVRDMSLTGNEKATIEDKAVDNARLQANADALNAYRESQLEISRLREELAASRERRLAETGGGGSTTSDVRKRGADSWYATELYKLSQLLADQTMDQTQYNAAKANLDRAYKIRLGEPDTGDVQPAPPIGAEPVVKSRGAGRDIQLRSQDGGAGTVQKGDLVGAPAEVGKWATQFKVPPATMSTVLDVLRQNNIKVTEQNLRTFLNNPANRARLGLK